MKKHHLFLLITFSLTCVVNAQIDFDLKNITDSCQHYYSMEKKSYDILNLSKSEKDSILNILIHNEHQCKEIFLYFSYTKFSFLDQEQTEVVSQKLHTIIKHELNKVMRKEIVLRYGILKLISKYHLSEFRYELAKLMDPDFFDNFQNYYLNTHLSFEPPIPCLVTSDEIRKNAAIISTLINLGDTLLETRYIDVVLNTQKQLSKKVLTSYTQLNKGEPSSFHHDIRRIDNFYDDMSPYLLSNIFSFKSLDSFLPMARFVLSELFLYTETRDNRKLTGSVVIDQIFERMKYKARKQIKTQIHLLYYFTCDDKVKEPFLCDEAWNKILTIYQKARADKSLWRNSMR